MSFTHSDVSSGPPWGKVGWGVVTGPKGGQERLGSVVEEAICLSGKSRTGIGGSGFPSTHQSLTGCDLGQMTSPE